MESKCSQCTLRGKYDVKPNSFAGKFWRWHINFCPGWKGYFTSLSTDEQNEIREKYNFRKTFK